MTNAHSKMGKMAVCCQNLLLGALSSRSVLSALVGTLFQKFGLFLNTPRNLLEFITTGHIGLPVSKILLQLNFTSLRTFSMMTIMA